MTNKMDFIDKNILVGGATNGIGWSSAKQFAERGGNVTLASRNIELLKQRVSTLFNGIQKHYIIPLDFPKPIELEQSLKEFISKNSIEYDIVINNSGGPPSGALENAQSEDLLSALNLHLISFHKILRRIILSGMKNKDSGRIINIISTSVKQPLNGLGVSNTVRGAVANWSKTLANELGSYNITVNNVLPGATNTGRLKEIIKSKAQKLNIGEKDVEEQMASQVPLKRIAEPDEVANAVLFLASSKASYINGINLPVDGGRTKSL